MGGGRFNSRGESVELTKSCEKEKMPDWGWHRPAQTGSEHADYVTTALTCSAPFRRPVITECWLHFIWTWIGLPHAISVRKWRAMCCTDGVACVLGAQGNVHVYLTASAWSTALYGRDRAADYQKPDSWTNRDQSYRASTLCAQERVPNSSYYTLQHKLCVLCSVSVDRLRGLATVGDSPRWPCDSPLSAKVGTKFRQQVAVAQSV
jgi:hypothetical protein